MREHSEKYAGPTSAIEGVATKYCETDLAAQLGATTLPPPKAGVNLDAFRHEALARWNVGAPEADASKLDAVATAQSICDGDVATMVANLGSKFEGSFQQFAMQTFCPDKLSR